MSRHVVLWLSAAAADLELPPGADRVVRYALAGDWPERVDGVAVEPVHALVPPDLTDAAHHAAVRLMSGMGGTPGADGQRLDEVTAEDGLSLWWNLELLVFDRLRLWVRAVDATLAVLERLRPERVTVWGTDPAAPWLRDAVQQAARTHGAPVELAPLERAFAAERRARWAGSGCVPRGGWRAPADPGETFQRRAARGSTVEAGPGATTLTTRGGELVWETVAPREPGRALVVHARAFAPVAPASEVGFDLEAAGARIRVLLWRDRVQLGGKDAALAPGRARDLTLVLRGDDAELSVDGAPVLACAAERAPLDGGPGARLAWGHFAGSGDAASYWERVEWGTGDPALPADGAELAARARAALSRLREAGRGLVKRRHGREHRGIGGPGTAASGVHPAGLTGAAFARRGHGVDDASADGRSSDVPAEPVRVTARHDGTHLVTLGAPAWFEAPIPAGTEWVALTLARHGGGPGTVGFSLSDGERGQRAWIDPGAVRLDGAPARAHATDRPTRYRLRLEGPAAHLEADGQLLISAPASVGGPAGLAAGHLAAGGDVESVWSEVAWGTMVSPAQLAGERREAELHARLDAEREAWRALAPARADPLAPDSGTPPLAELVRPPVPAPRASSRAPGTERVLLVHGGELAWWWEGPEVRVEDPMSEGLRDVTRLVVGPTPQLPAGLGDDPARLSLDRWAGSGPTPCAREVWLAWRGAPGTRAWPAHRGTHPGALIEAALAQHLPLLAEKAREARVLQRALAELRPRAVLSTHFATSFRHLLAPVRAAGAVSVSLLIGPVERGHLLHGVPGGCPRADRTSLWSDNAADSLPAEVRARLRATVTGRPRQDTFVRRPLASGGRRWVVFGDVLYSTVHTPILTWRVADRLLRAMLATLSRHPGVELVWKPWAGDDLVRVRALAGAIGDPRLTVLDPFTPGLHVADVLERALTVVSSPTSLLGEFAAMGGLPILLRLPDTLHYYGEGFHRAYQDLCAVVDAPDRMGEVLEAVLRADQRSLPPARLRALERILGPADGRSAARVMRLAEDQGQDTSPHDSV